VVPEDGEAAVGVIRAGVVDMQPATIAQLKIGLSHTATT
jgi:hypothetical protein